MGLYSSLKRATYLFSPLGNFFAKLKLKGKVRFNGRGIRVLNSEFEGMNMLSKGVIVCDSFVGLSSYINDNSVLYRVRVGRYCSIADNVKIGFGNHPTHFVSTHPAFYYDTTNVLGYTFTDDVIGNETAGVFKSVDTDGRCLAEIGSDVWIGSHSLIMDGVRIGTGAVIAAGSVVAKDVPPYAIVGGSPAKIIKYRHTFFTIERLLTSRWWEQPVEWIKDNSKTFCNLDEFIRKDI